MVTSPPSDTSDDEDYSELGPEAAAEIKARLDAFEEQFYKALLSNAKKKPEYREPKVVDGGSR